MGQEKIVFDLSDFFIILTALDAFGDMETFFI